MIAVNNEQPDYRNLWDTPEVLFNIRPMKIVQCETESEVPGLGRNPSHLLLGTEEEFNWRHKGIVDRVGEVLAFDDRRAWRRQRPFLLALVRRFFAEDSDAPAWLSMVPCRVPFERRFEQCGIAWSDVRPTEWVQSPTYLAAGKHVTNCRLDLGYGIGQFGLDTLLLCGGPQARRRHVRLVRQLRTRSLSRHGLPELSDLVFYLGDPGADKALIDKGLVPAMTTYYDAEQDLLTTVAIVLAKATRSRPPDVVQLIVTYRPGDGWTAALASGGRSLKTFLLQYPLENDLLLQAVYG